MNTLCLHTLLPLCVLALAAPLQAATAGDLPVSGKPVPELAAFDDAMQSFMKDESIEAGILGVMRDGVVVYMRGFGYLDPGWPLFGLQATPLSEMSMMRVASCEKPLTAAAIHKLAATGAISLDDNVFDLGQWDGGILQITPFGGLQDQYLTIVTVQDLLDHRGGWDRGLISYDPMFEAISIANALGVPSPAGREQIASYMLGQPLQWIPGTTTVYSNFGYMLLGMILEDVTGMAYEDYMHQAVFDPDWWVPSTELIHGRSFKANQSPREPYYRNSGSWFNVFDPTGPKVSNPYGTWHHEAMVGHGNMVASAAPLLYFLDEYVTWGGSIGKPSGGNVSTAHTGGLAGTNTVMRQRSDGLHVVVLFNGDGQPHLGNAMSTKIQNLADTQITTWPTASVDGFWVDVGASSSGLGGYHDPLGGVSGALSNTVGGSKWRLHPGSTSWTGVIDQRVLIDSPLPGVTVIGQ